VTADHEEKTDNGYQRRTFVRQYSLPKGVDAEHVRPTLTKDGVLTIEAKAHSLQPGERLVPIAYKWTEEAVDGCAISSSSELAWARASTRRKVFKRKDDGLS